jgi:hypothetical protein
MKLETLGKSLIAFAIINFAIFWIVAIRIGGDAVNGKIEDGRYYVGSHGRYTEVSNGVWKYSEIQAKSIWVTHPIGFIGALIVYKKRRRKNEAT